MLKQSLQAVAFLALTGAAANVLAHPGAHDHLQGWAGLIHFVTQPNHVGVVGGIALVLFALLTWSALRRR